MDKFVIVGGFLCFAADVFAIASLATPEWVVMEFAGKRRAAKSVKYDLLEQISRELAELWKS